MHTVVNVLAVVGAFAICAVIFLGVMGIKTLEDGAETGGDHRSEEEREKDGSI